MKDKIIYLTYQTFPSDTANTIQTIDNAKYMKRKGYDITIIFPLRSKFSTDDTNKIKKHYDFSEDIEFEGVKHNLPFGKYKLFEKYFPLNVKMNKQGYEDVALVLQKGTTPISPHQFEDLANEMGAVVLDVRHQDEFAKKHIPRSIFIGIDGGFAPWVGTLIGDVKQPILLVTPEGLEEETVTRLARVGFDNTLGYLEGGIAAWDAAGKEFDEVESHTAHELKSHLLKEKSVIVFDVRQEGEYISQHMSIAKHSPLNYINDYFDTFPKDKTFYIHCAGGYRSMIAASILKSRGVHNFIDVAGGFKAIQEAAIDTTDYICPTTN